MPVSDPDVSRPRLVRDATFLEADRREIALRRGPHNRLGFAYQVAFVRVLGRFPQQTPLEILAHGCNLGLYTMEKVAPDIAYRRLKYVSDWRLVEENQRAALAAIVHGISRLDAAGHWGDGTTSASDGQRFAMPQKVLQRTYSTRFNDFALEFYSFVADNYAPFYSPGPGTRWGYNSDRTPITRSCAGVPGDRPSPPRRPVFLATARPPTISHAVQAGPRLRRRTRGDIRAFPARRVGGSPLERPSRQRRSPTGPEDPPVAARSPSLGDGGSRPWRVPRR